MQVTTLPKIVLSLLVVVLVLGYSAFRFAQYYAGPEIVVETPENGATLETNFIEVRGTAESISNITLNGRQIFTNPEGTFSENVLLSTGYNAIEIRVEDRFGRSESTLLQVVSRPPAGTNGFSNATTTATTTDEI